MRKEVTKLGLFLFGLIIWSTLTYAAFAFYKAEINPFTWSESTRGAMMFVMFCYVPFGLIILLASEDDCSTDIE
jgi:hypothetical protein